MKLKTVQRSLLPIGVAVGVVLTDRLSSWLKEWLTRPGVEVLFSVVVIAISIELVKVFAETLFDHSRFLRRFLLGSEYLEGTWFDIMKVAGKPSEVGLSWFTYDDWELQYSGEDYDLKPQAEHAELAMEHRFPYTAEKIVHLKNNKLLYKFTADRSDRDDLEIAGYGELQLHPGDRGIPTRYSGHYYRPEGGGVFRKISFEGFRLDETRDRDCLRRLNSPETRKDAMRELLKRLG